MSLALLLCYFVCKSNSFHPSTTYLMLKPFFRDFQAWNWLKLIKPIYCHHGPMSQSFWAKRKLFALVAFTAPLLFVCNNLNMETVFLDVSAEITTEMCPWLARKWANKQQLPVMCLTGVPHACISYFLESPTFYQSILLESLLGGIESSLVTLKKLPLKCHFHEKGKVGSVSQRRCLFWQIHSRASILAMCPLGAALHLVSER